MLVTEFYNGQGLGNQLWCYFVTKVIATKNGYAHGVMSPEKFKGKDFLTLDFGNIVTGGDGPEGGPPNKLPNGINNYYREKITRHPNGIDISKMDTNMWALPDNTKVDGNMQSIYYLQEYKEQIESWCNISKDLQFDLHNICLIHIRGGDFLGSSAYLNSEYYNNAISHMKEINNELTFKIITDDINYAKTLCPNIEIIGSIYSEEKDPYQASHHMGGPIWLDWLLLYHAEYSIISASSFSFWPTWLGKSKKVIAPMYWADYKNSDGYWSCGDSLIPDWYYLNRNGKLLSYQECLMEKIDYENINNKYWTSV